MKTWRLAPCLKALPLRILHKVRSLKSLLSWTWSLWKMSRWIKTRNRQHHLQVSSTHLNCYFDHHCQKEKKLWPSQWTVTRPVNMNTSFWIRKITRMSFGVSAWVKLRHRSDEQTKSPFFRFVLQLLHEIHWSEFYAVHTFGRSCFQVPGGMSFVTRNIFVFLLGCLCVCVHVCIPEILLPEKKKHFLMHFYCI